MSEFRETLAHALGHGDGMARFEPDYADADAILAMPEMQAIRLCLFRMAIRLADDRYDGVVRDVFTNYGLTESVIEWMSS